jgi:hypothetical protein
MSNPFRRAIVGNQSRIKGSFQLIPSTATKKPFDLLPQKTKDPYLKALFILLDGYSLQGVKRIDFAFDPFFPSVSSIRYVVKYIVQK